MIGRVRLWSAYVLFFYVVTHLLNHALGLISLRVLEVGRTWFVFIWHNPLGQTVLYGALFTHFFLALWSLYRRRALTLSRWEWTQLVLGALIIPLGALHVVGTRLAHELYGVEPGYPWVLGSLVVERLDVDHPPVPASPGRLAACLHRPAFRVAPAILVSRLAAGALCHRPARPRRRHRGRGDRLARRRRSCPAAGLPRKPVRPRARAAAGRHRQPLCHFAQSPDRGARSAGRRSGRASAARLLGTTRRRRASRLRRTPQREPAGRAHDPGDEPSCRHPACVGVRRTRPLLDLPGSHRRRASRPAAAALAGRTEGADEGRRAGQCAARLPAPSRRPAITA